MATLRCAWMGVLVLLCLSFSNAHRVLLLDNNYGQGTGIGYGTNSGCVIGSGTSGNSNSAINKAIIGVGTVEDCRPLGANIGGDDQIYRRVITPLNQPPKSENADEPKPPDTSDELRRALIEGSDTDGPDPPPDCPDKEATPPLNTSDDQRKALSEGGDPPQIPPPDATYNDPTPLPDDIDFLIPYPPPQKNPPN